MNTHEIREMLKRNEKTRDVFLDVYAADQLPNKKIDKAQWLLVCNCCPSNLPGVHWIAIFGNANLIEVFDSFGLVPSVYKGVHEFLDAQRPINIIYNPKRVQSYDSTVCGHYCLYFAHHRANGISMNTIVDAIERMDRDEFIKCLIVNSLFRQ